MGTGDALATTAVPQLPPDVPAGGHGLSLGNNPMVSSWGVCDALLAIALTLYPQRLPALLKPR